MPKSQNAPHPNYNFGDPRLQNVPQQGMTTQQAFGPYQQPSAPGMIPNYTGQQGQYYGSQSQPGFNMTKLDPATLGPDDERGFVQNPVGPAPAPQPQLGVDLRMPSSFANSDHFRNAYINDQLAPRPERKRFTNPYQPPGHLQASMAAAALRRSNPGSGITDQERMESVARRAARTTPWRG